MGDSETVVAEASAAEAYPPAGYNNTVSNPVNEAGATVEISGEAAAQANSSYEFAYSGDGNAYAAGDPNSVLQQAQFGATNESKQGAGVPDANEASGVSGKEAMESAMVSVNGGVGTVGLENGNALENVDGSDDKQLTDAYGIYMLFFTLTLPILFTKSKVILSYCYLSFEKKSEFKLKARYRACR